MDNILPLGGDLDGIDLLEDIERTFAIKLPTDLSHCHTVGDLHRVLLSLIPHAERGKTGCLAAKAHCRLQFGESWTLSIELSSAIRTIS